MSSEWRRTQLKEVASIRNGAGIKQENFSDIGIPLVRVTNFTDSSVDLKDCVKVAVEHAPRWKSHELKSGDVLVATVGSWPPNWSSVVGKSVCVPSAAAGAIQNQNTCCIQAIPRLADQRFLYYVTRTADFGLYAANSASGSANQARLPVAKLEAFEFDIPDYLEQVRIGETLGFFDDRIALLRETNATLEAIAQALFKSWFVDFDPVHANAGTQAPSLPPEIQALFPATFTDSPQGPIPDGWNIGKVEDLMELAYGKALKATDRVDGEVPVYGSGGITGLHNQALVNDPSIIVGRKGTVGSLYWEDRPFFPIDTVFYVKSDKPLSYCFYLLQTLGLHDMNTDGAVPGLNRNNVYRLPVVIPPNGIFHVFDEIVAVIRETIFNNNQQVLSLASLRDTLLPRLISGHLHFPADKAVNMDEM
jgi:type I restriction enzyme S subunit